MSDADAGKRYADVMAEIKRRSRVIHTLMTGQNTVVYLPTTIESVGLQFRKIFELIALGSLVANKRVYSEAHANFSKHWEAHKLIANLKRLNPEFYPKPVTVVRQPEPGIEADFKAMTDGYLTPDELVEAHGRCGDLLHARNPFGKAIDLDDYNQKFTLWFERVVKLLNFHNVHLVGETGFWHVQIGDFSNDIVTYNYFAPAPP